MIDSKQSLILNVRGGARICVPADIEQITSYILFEQDDWLEDEVRFVRLLATIGALGTAKAAKGAWAAFAGSAAYAGRSEWLTCAVVEQYEKLRHHSSLYVDKTSLEVLAPIGDLPYRSAEVDRRRQLVRRRHGMPPVPASPLLLAASEENLNPQYWGARG